MKESKKTRASCADALSKRAIEVTGVSVTGRNAEHKGRKPSRKCSAFINIVIENCSI